MHDQVESILSNVSRETFETIARRVLGDPTATIAGAPTFEEITTSHNDQRTIGIVKVEGRAATNSGGRDWSTVVKAIDPSLASGDAARWSFVENEQKVYELGLFAEDGLPLRPAKCHLVQTTEEGIVLLWIEDLSFAPQPPWTLEHFISAANHLGHFNGYHAARSTVLPFDIGRDAYHFRWVDQPRRENSEELIENRESKSVRDAYGSTPVESYMEFVNLYEQALEKAKAMPHGLTFGDSHARNMFPIDAETVGIDWANMAFDPIGVDVGVLIGSALTYGVDEAETVSPNERIIFDSYMSGLRSAGWDGEVDHVRLGFFLQFGGYLSTLSSLPARIDELGDRRAWLEHRQGAPIEELPAQIAPTVALIPKYTDELKQLLG